jgi:hypothetical protein
MNAVLFSPVRAICLAHLTLFATIILLVMNQDETNFVKLLTMLVSTVSDYFIPLGSKYNSQHYVLKHLQIIIFPQY